MKFLKMRNLGPSHLYRLDKDLIYKINTGKDIGWLTMLKAKIELVYAIHNVKILINLIIMVFLALSISTIEIRRSFPKKHVKIYLTSVFYYFLLAHLALVLFLYIYLAETGRINYSDTLMVIIITVTPSAFFKTTIFETRSGRSFGLENIYKRIMASIDAKIMKSRYDKLVGLENVIAYSNSQDSMKDALYRMYRNNPSKATAGKLIQKMEEELANENDYMNRKRAAARLIMRQFDREQLMAEGFVPPYWDFNDSIDPLILLRHTAKFCAEDKARMDKVEELLKADKEDLKESKPEKYKEMIDVHKKELMITMSHEGELLVKLRFLMVLRNFNLNWFIEQDLLTKEKLDEIRKLSKPVKRKKLVWWKRYFTKKSDADSGGNSDQKSNDIAGEKPVS
jgi:hypothetical protein